MQDLSLRDSFYIVWQCDDVFFVKCVCRLVITLSICVHFAAPDFAAAHQIDKFQMNIFSSNFLNASTICKLALGPLL